MALFKKSFIRIAFIGIVLTANVIGLWFYLSPQENKSLKIYFFDIGQGDSALIKTPNQQNILIDGGQDDSVLQPLSHALGIFNDTIDVVIITHPHEDHIGGLWAVINKYNVKQIIYTGALYDSPIYVNLLSLIAEKKIPLGVTRDNEIARLGDNCDLKIIHPNQSLHKKSDPNVNNTSIATMLDCEGARALFMGDIEADIESEILESEKNLRANILKIGHHGSDTSSSIKFLNAIMPDFAVISVGANNTFGHPSRLILRRLNDIDAKILRTDEIGNVIFEIKDGEIKKAGR